MATITKQLLSGSTHGRGIKVAATGTAGTLIHTAINNTSDFDEVWLWASNFEGSDIKLTLEFGGTTSVDDHIVVKVAAESTELVCPGLVLRDTLVVRAFAGTGNKISIFGYVNRMDY